MPHAFCRKRRYVKGLVANLSVAFQSDTGRRVAGADAYSWRMRCEGLRPDGTATTTTHIAIIANPINSKTNASTAMSPDQDR